MKSFKTASLSALRQLSSALLITTCMGCASFVVAPIPDDERDTSGQFDGSYNGVVEKMALRQQVGNSYFRCRSEPHTAFFKVKNGEITTNFSGKKQSANVSADGRFYMEIASDQHYGKRTDGLTVAGSEVTYIYRGRLGETGKGAFVIGNAGVGNGGCSANMQIAKKT